MKRQYNDNNPTFRKKSNFEAASAILQKAFKKYGLDDRLTKYKFVASWPEIMGKAIADRSKPEYIRNNTLYIKVSDSAWAQELSFQKDVILKRLNRFLDKETLITDIRFFVGNIQ